MKTSQKLNLRLLEVIGRRHPAIYDLIFPQFSLETILGPQPEPWKQRISAVALNPQPLPPAELGAALASEFVRNVWLVDRFGLDLGRISTVLDDWCPTYPRRFKLPPWWPPIPEPDPEPDWFIDFHLGFATRLATVALEDTHISESINNAIERSLSAIKSLDAKK